MLYIHYIDYNYSFRTSNASVDFNNQTLLIIGADLKAVLSFMNNILLQRVLTVMIFCFSLAVCVCVQKTLQSACLRRKAAKISRT